MLGLNTRLDKKRRNKTCKTFFFFSYRQPQKQHIQRQWTVMSPDAEQTQTSPWAPAPNRNAQKYEEVEEKAPIRRGCVLCSGKWRTVNSPKRLEERELHQSEVFSHLQVIVSTNREITLKGVHIRRTAVWPIEAGWTTGAGVKELTLNWIKVSLLTFHSIPYNLTNDWFHAETKNTVSFCIILWTWCLSKVNWHQGKAG